MFFLKDIQLFVLITAMQFVGYCTDKQNVCTTEHSLVSVDGRTYDAVWKCKSNSHHSVVLSEPPCLDENKSLMARVCSNSIWMTKTEICSSLEENKLCPVGYIQDEATCTFLTEPLTFDTHCSFPGATSKITDKYNLVWLPVKRKIQYGPYEYIWPGENYGLDFFDEHSSEVIISNSNTGDKDCVIVTNNGIELVLCNSLHVHVCSYKYNQFLYRCPPGCVPGGLKSNYCFCKVLSENGVHRSALCEKLAVPRYSYERNILRKLVEDDICWIGDLQENSHIRQDYYRPFLYLAINKREWSFHKNGELNCAICEVAPISYEDVDLMLTFNSKSHKLYLNVYSPESIFNNDEEDLVYCFTDATDKLKTRVETEGTWDSTSEVLSGRRLKVFRVSIEEDSPGYYWCEAFQLPEISLIKSNVVVAYKDFKGHEYSLRLIIYNFCRYSIIQCQNPSVSFVTQISKNLFNGGFFSKFIKRVRLFHIYNIDKSRNRVDVLLHLTSKGKLPILAEYFALYRNLQLVLKFQQIAIIFFRSSEVCLPENTLSEDNILHWKMSNIGTIRTPEEVCIQENGEPVRRQCQGDFRFGSQWSEVKGSCSQNIKLSSKTEFLHSLVSSDISANLTKNISTVTENSTDLTILDLHYLAEVLFKISAISEKNYEKFLDEMIQIIDNLMKTNTTIMKLSQNLLNATDEILDTFENTLLSTTANEDIFLLKKSKLIIQISKPFLNNITGLVLYGDDSVSFLNSKIVPLYANTTFDSLLDDDDLQIAVYIPEKLLKIISQNLTNGTESNVTVVTTVYYTDNFFNSDKNVANTTVSSKVVSVSIPGYDELLQTAIPILFKSQNYHQQKCAFWNYGTSSETRSGYWSTLGGNYLGQLNNSSLEICSFTHLTNFALLVMSGEFSASDDASVSYNLQVQTNEIALTVISNTGSLLSLFGILGIFTTNLVFQSWREKVGTKILIQLCVTILLQIIFLNIAEVSSPTDLSFNYCIIVGIILHYVIISEFCWMLVAAVLQFLRFVKVLGPMPNRLILKAMLVGWGLPILPVLIVCVLDYQSYAAGIQGLCYPKGTSMYYGVVFPIACVICINLAVFIAVIRNVFVLRVEIRSSSQTILKQQICLAILLFFLLGLPWIFGLLAEIMNHDSVLSYILVYLFCFTASVQGFVLFLFYVVLDKSTRTLWQTLFKRVLNKKLC